MTSAHQPHLPGQPDDRATDRTTAGWAPPASRQAVHDGRSPLERYAIARLRADVAAMPASEIVQLILWPQTVADWARDAQVAPAVVYNLLSRFKPYRRVRDLLALRLEMPVAVLDHLVDAPRPLPSSLRAPTSAAADGGPLDGGPLNAEPAPPPTADEWRRAGSPLPTVRDGGNPLELRAVYRVWHDAAALHASLLVQLSLFPETLALWARRRRIPPSLLYGVLAGTQRHSGIREALARQLGLSIAAIDHAIDAPRREPARPAAIPLADAPPSPEPAGVAPHSPRASTARGATSPVEAGEAGDVAQLSLGI